VTGVRLPTRVGYPMPVVVERSPRRRCRCLSSGTGEGSPAAACARMRRDPMTVRDGDGRAARTVFGRLRTG
jgi:hypothetical protein